MVDDDIIVKNLEKEFLIGNILKGRKKITALKNVTFNVTQGEVFGLLGKNGAGKTTLIRILCGLVRPTAGHATVFGYDIVKQSINIRKRIALLPQEASCYETLTARENILYYGGMHGVPDEELRKRTEDLIHVIGLEERADDVTKEFSGGMKRKVLVARALVTNPDLIFLDEPTTGIDILGARVIRNLIKNLSKDMKKTIVLTTHDLTEVNLLCDRVGIMNEGNLVAVGRSSELEHKFKTSGLEDIFIGLTTGELDFV
ncbi:MAG: ABC transporter ATP-binding protein [Candidatus Odinarchaeota archaeon]